MQNSKWVSEYRIGDDRHLHLRLRFQGRGWGVYLGATSGALSSKTLTFDYEPMPSHRNEDFFLEYRFSTPEEGLKAGLRAIEAMLSEKTGNVSLFYVRHEELMSFLANLASAAEDFGVSSSQVDESQIVEFRRALLSKLQKESDD